MLFRSDLQLDLNTGLRAKISGGHQDAQTGAWSYDDAGVSFDFTTIDFSKSTWKDSHQVVHQGYAIETGNPDEPIQLLYDEQMLRVFGHAVLDVFGVVHIDGSLDFRASESQGITIFADAEARLGTEDFGITAHVTGLLVIGERNGKIGRAHV